MVFLPSSALRVRAWDNSPVCKNQSETDQLTLCSPRKLDRRQVQCLEEAYDVQKVLGRGGFGIVRCACLRSGGPLCAVKSIRKRTCHMEELANNEARILRCLSHSGINKLLNVCEDAEHIHLVLELVNGHELFEEIADYIPLRETRSACIMRQMFAALQYCHDIQRSVIHRDIKPENIMISDSIRENVPQVKIIDWGLAIVCEDAVKTAVVGTACYLAPESLRKGTYSRASDMWSAGAVLHMLLSGGTLPEQEKSGSSVVTNVFQELGTSEAALDLLHGLLSSSACQRLAATEACRNKWVCGQACDASTSEISLQRQDSCKVNHVNSKHDKMKHPLPLTDNSQANWISVSQYAVSRCDNDFIIFDDFSDSTPRDKQTHDAVGSPETRKGCKQRSRKAEQCKENCGHSMKTTSWQEKTKLLGDKADGIAVQGRPLLLR